MRHFSHIRMNASSHIYLSLSLSSFQGRCKLEMEKYVHIAVCVVVCDVVCDAVCVAVCVAVCIADLSRKEYVSKGK